MVRLTRSNDRIIAGVIGGLADYLRMDVSVLRLITIVLLFFSLIVPIVVFYIAAWIIVPEA